jgi:hypothetical protein
MIRSPARLLATLTIACAALGAQVQAIAQPLSELEAAKVREVIVQQLSALAVDDAEKAFATATPEVRQQIGSSNRFLSMVRGAYPMVYRPAAVNFHKPEFEDGSVLQLVEIKDEKDKAWLALFALEQQSDQTWRISGCVVAENHWIET